MPKRNLFQKSVTHSNDDSISRMLLEAFCMQHEYEIHDFFCSLILSECVYKAADAGHAAALASLNSFRDQFPIGTVPLECAQFCRRRVDHRYMLATGGGALYVAFMGTKELRDVVVDAAVGKRVLWWAGRDDGEGEDEAATKTATATTAAAATATATAGGVVGVDPPPSVHGGFLNRADGIPVESLYLHARCAGLRLVLCGHSLGGAVATLATLRLLSALTTAPPLGDVQCICFGTPPFASNRALEEYIRMRKWTGHFTSYALPEDPIPRLLLRTSTRQPAVPAVDGEGSVPAKTMSSTMNNNGVVDVDALLVAQAEEEESSQRDAVSHTHGNTTDNQSETQFLKTTVLEKRNTGELPETQRGSSSWTVGTTLKAVVRNTAGAVRLPSITVPMPVFAHFGDPLYLLPSGVSSTLVPRHNNGSSHTGGKAQQYDGNKKHDGEGEGTVGVDEALPILKNQPRGWMATHRMATYRARVLEMVRYATLKNTGRDTTRIMSSAEDWKDKVKGGGVIEAAVLLPHPRPVHAEGVLPVLWRSTTTTTKDTNDAIEVDTKFATTTEKPPSQPASWLWPWSKKIASGTDGASGTTRPPPTAGGTKRQRRPGVPATCTLQVSVRGDSLDLCTGAALHFSGGVVVDGEIIENNARQRVLHEIRAPMPSMPHSDHAAPSLLQSLRSKLHVHAKLAPRGAGNLAEPDLVLRFILPTGVILQLQQPETIGSEKASPFEFSPSLILFSDFGKGTTAATLRARTTWILPIEPLVGKAAFEKLQQSAMTDVNDAARSAQTGTTFAQRLLPQFLLGPRRVATATPMAVQPGTSPETQEPMEQKNDSDTSSFSVSSLRSRAAKTLQGLWHGSDRLRSSLTELHPIHTVPATLLRGVVVLDASFALDGPDQPTEKLALAADLLKWKSEQSVSAPSLESKDPRTGHPSPQDKRIDLKNNIDPISTEDQFLNLPFSDVDHGLDLGGSIRRGLKHAAQGVRRRSALLRRWHAFRALPAPDVVVVVLGPDTLAPIPQNPCSSQDSSLSLASEDRNTVPRNTLSAMNVDVLNGIQAVVTAASKCHAAVLLAVARPEARDASFRRRLSFSTGLHGRPGAVVPLMVLTERDGGNALRTHLLEAAVLAHASLAAQNEQRQRVERESGGVFRARL